MTDGLRIELIKQALQPQTVEERDRVRPSQTSGKGGEGQAASQLQFSPQAQDLREALQALKSLPDVRERRIEELKEQIAQGQFNVIPELLVQKLMERLFPG